MHVLLSQVEFVFEQYQQAMSSQLDSDYHQMMGEKAIADNNMLKVSLSKAVKIIFNNVYAYRKRM